MIQITTPTSFYGPPDSKVAVGGATNKVAPDAVRLLQLYDNARICLTSLDRRKPRLEGRLRLHGQPVGAFLTHYPLTVSDIWQCFWSLVRHNR